MNEFGTMAVTVAIGLLIGMVFVSLLAKTEPKDEPHPTYAYSHSH